MGKDSEMLKDSESFRMGKVTQQSAADNQSAISRSSVSQSSVSRQSVIRQASGVSAHLPHHPDEVRVLQHGEGHPHAAQRPADLQREGRGSQLSPS